MKKSLLALAVFGAFTGVASAQTSVTVYGIVDMGIARETGGAAGSVTRLGNGMQSGSRLGFRGTEDLGSGLKAMFVLETGINADTGGFGQSNTAFGRQALVGLGGNFGMVSMGRQIQSQFIALDEVDPFSTGLAGQTTNLFTYPTATSNRNINSLKYTAPAMGPVSAEIMYGFGEVAGNTSAKRTLGGSIGYANGPVLVKLSYEKDNDGANSAAAVTTSGSSKYTQLTGSYDFGVAKLAMAYRKDKASGLTTTVNANKGMVGVTVPFGAGAFLASYVRSDDRLAANKDADQFGIGYTYAMSKRTNLYTSYARISNDNGAAFTVGDASSAGSGDKAFSVGLRHKF